jgi:hypothetical protein
VSASASSAQGEHRSHLNARVPDASLQFPRRPDLSRSSTSRQLKIVAVSPKEVVERMIAYQPV